MPATPSLSLNKEMQMEMNINMFTNIVIGVLLLVFVIVLCESIRLVIRRNMEIRRLDESTDDTELDAQCQREYGSSLDGDK